jgi:hypothetical protein
MSPKAPAYAGASTILVKRPKTIFSASVKGVSGRKNMNKQSTTKSTTIAIAVLTATTALLSIKLYAATPNPPKPQPPPQPSLQPQPQIWTPGCVAQVPRAWGTYRGASAQSGLAFEDSAGTIRFLTNIPCDGTPIVSLEIHRTAATTQ